LEPIIKTENLTYTYNPNTPFSLTAIQGINFSVQKGEFIGLIGHTGSGKSTLVQHLNGLLNPTAGTVLFNGENMHESKEKAHSVRFRVGLVFQYPEYQLFEETTYQDIAFGPKNMRLPASEVDARVRQAAELVGLEKADLQKSPFELSGGQKRRAAIAGVMAMYPEVLILDEPTAGLDPEGQEALLRNIRRYHEETGATVIMVSHSMEEIARNVERLVVMRRGTILMDGPTAEVFARGEELAETGLAVPQVTRVARTLRRMGLAVDEAVYTVEQAAEAILRLWEGRGHA